MAGVPPAPSLAAGQGPGFQRKSPPESLFGTRVRWRWPAGRGARLGGGGGQVVVLPWLPPATRPRAPRPPVEHGAPASKRALLARWVGPVTAPASVQPATANNAGAVWPGRGRARPSRADAALLARTPRRPWLGWPRPGKSPSPSQRRARLRWPVSGGARCGGARERVGLPALGAPGHSPARTPSVRPARRSRHKGRPCRAWCAGLSRLQMPPSLPRTPRRPGLGGGSAPGGPPACRFERASRSPARRPAFVAAGGPPPPLAKLRCATLAPPSDPPSVPHSGWPAVPMPLATLTAWLAARAVSPARPAAADSRPWQGGRPARCPSCALPGSGPRPEDFDSPPCPPLGGVARTEGASVRRGVPPAARPVGRCPPRRRKLRKLRFSLLLRRRPTGHAAGWGDLLFRATALSVARAK